MDKAPVARPHCCQNLPTPPTQTIPSSFPWLSHTPQVRSRDYDWLKKWSGCPPPRPRPGKKSLCLCYSDIFLAYRFHFFHILLYCYQKQKPFLSKDQFYFLFLRKKDRSLPAKIADSEFATGWKLSRLFDLLKLICQEYRF